MDGKIYNRYKYTERYIDGKIYNQTDINRQKNLKKINLFMDSRHGFIKTDDSFY